MKDKALKTYSKEFEYTIFGFASLEKVTNFNLKKYSALFYIKLLLPIFIFFLSSDCCAPKARLPQGDPSWTGNPF